MSLEEFEQTQDSKTRRYIQRKSIMDVGMGVIYVGVGIVILFAERLGFNNEFAISTPGKIFAGLFLLYGLWRVYRGIKKDYLKEK